MRRKAVHVRIGETDALKVGLSRFNWRDPYYAVLTVGWRGFFGLILGFYTGANLFFGTLYWLAPDSIRGIGKFRWLNDIFFSVETIGTVGYGEMSPHDLYGHLLASFEVVFGLV